MFKERKDVYIYRNKKKNSSKKRKEKKKNLNKLVTCRNKIF